MSAESDGSRDEMGVSYSLSPGSRIKLIENRLLASYINKAKQEYGPDYDDYLAILPELEKVAQWEIELRRKSPPFDTQTRSQVKAYIDHLRLFLPLLPAELDASVQRPKRDDTDASLHRNLQEHIGLLLTWCRCRAEYLLQETEAQIAKEDAVQEAHSGEEPQILRHRASAIAFAMVAWCLVLAFSAFDAIWPYQLSRWAIASAALWLAFGFGKNTPRALLCFAVAVVFNPLAPIRFGDTWPVINVIGALAFVSLTPISATLWDPQAWRRGWTTAKEIGRYSLLVLIVMAVVALIAVYAYIAWTTKAEKEAADLKRRQYDEWAAKQTGWMRWHLDNPDALKEP